MDAYPMKSKLDAAIYRLAEVWVDDNDKTRDPRGLALRHIRYVLGSYEPREGSVFGGPTQFRWLDGYRKQLLSEEVITADFPRYSPSQVSNACTKLCRRGVLEKIGKRGGRYRLGQCFVYPGTGLADVKRLVRTAKEGDSISNGIVTFIGVSRLEGDPNIAKDVTNLLDVVNNYAIELNRSIWDAIERFREDKKAALPQLPIIVINYASLYDEGKDLVRTFYPAKESRRS